MPLLSSNTMFRENIILGMEPCSSFKKIMYDDGLSIAFGAVDVVFYITLYIFLNLMNRESFYENLVVRGIIGIVIVDLISHWFVIFFESEFTCTEKFEQADLSSEGFFQKQTL